MKLTGATRPQLIGYTLARRMHRAGVSPEDCAFIAARILAFGSEAPPERRWLLPFVEEFGALPLYLGWTETLGILPDGSLVRWSTESEYSGLRPVTNQADASVALVEGSRRYPELAHLIPKRPAHATTCTACAGTGRAPVPSGELICACGGTGWVTSNESGTAG